jgi:hypothetical protein
LHSVAPHRATRRDVSALLALIKNNGMADDMDVPAQAEIAV